MHCPPGRCTGSGEPGGASSRDRTSSPRWWGTPLAAGNGEILGLDLHTSEDGAGWTAFLRGLVAHGLTGVRLVISDAHPGLVDAIASTVPGASWQRCRTHFLRNLLTRVPKSAGPFVATLVRSVFAQPDTPTTHAQHTRVIEQLAERFPAAAEMLEDAGSDILAFARFPRPHWRQIWSKTQFMMRDVGVGRAA